MVFSRRFPRDVKGSPYPNWEEVYLSKEEEQHIEQEQRKANIELMKECIEDATKIVIRDRLEDEADDLIEIAIALFEKRASHAVYWKEESTKEKFDKAFGRQ